MTRELLSGRGNLSQLGQIGIRIAPISVRGVEFFCRSAFIAFVPEYERHDQMTATVGSIVLEHLLGGEFGELPVTGLHGAPCYRFQTEQALRPSIRSRQSTKSAFYVLYHGAPLPQ